MHVEKYTGRGRKEFESSVMVQDATVRKLQILAESTQRLSDEIKSTESEMPWRQIAGFRNTLVHGYLQIDESLVWVVIEEDLPRLKAAIVRMLQHINESGEP